MAKDYLDQHVVNQPPAQGVVNPVATVTPQGSPASLIAAARDRFGFKPGDTTTAFGGNVLTERVKIKGTTQQNAESDALQQKSNALVRGDITVRAANESTGAGVDMSQGAASGAGLFPDLTPRNMIPEFDLSGGKTGKTPKAAEEVQWWQKSSFDPSFQKYINESGGNAGRDPSLASAPAKLTARLSSDKPEDTNVFKARLFAPFAAQRVTGANYR